MPGQISSAVGVQEKILEMLRQEGPVPVYKLTKSLGLTYGAAQWHIDRLERRGLVYTVKIGGRRYVALKDANPFTKITVEDVINELKYNISAYGIEPQTPLQEALERLKNKAPHLAEALRLIAERKYDGR